MAKGLILFVHGLGGDGQLTWGDFPKHIAADSSLKAYDVAFFEYGIVYVDFKTQKRIPKLSAQWFREAARRNAVV